MQRTIYVLTMALALGCVSRQAIAQEDDDSSEKPAEQPAPPAKVSPEARAVLDKVSQAYSNLQTAQLDGTIRTTLPMPDKPEERSEKFTSGYQAPNKFRHELGGKLQIGSTGEKVYVYQQSANSYIQADIPEGKIPVQEIPQPIPQMLQGQNPSLLFALLRDPVRGLVNNMKEVNKIEDAKVEGKAYTALALRPQQGNEQITILFDPQTHLLKRFRVEIPPEELRDMGLTNAPNKPAITEIDYTTIKRNAKFDQKFFAWAPPKDAKDLASMMPESATNLVGKAAPNFTLDNMEGKKVSLADLKGQVVVLDFWATWCPPCVKSLPELEKLQRDEEGKDVQVYAVNLQEDREKVQSFLESKKLNIPVLLDTKGELAQKYSVTAIPQTVVIGKDGRIKKVYVGATPKTYADIRAQLEIAKKEAGPDVLPQTGRD